MKKMFLLVAVAIAFMMSGCVQTNSTININGDNNNITVPQTVV